MILKRIFLLIFSICFSGCSSLEKFKPEKHTYIKYVGPYQNIEFKIQARRTVLNEEAKRENSIQRTLNAEIYDIANSMDKSIYPAYRHQFAEGVVKHAKSLHDRFVFKATINREQEIQDEVRFLKNRLESQTSWMGKNDISYFTSSVSLLTNHLLVISEQGGYVGKKLCIPDKLKDLNSINFSTSENKSDALEKAFWKHSKTYSESNVLNAKQEIYEVSNSEFLLSADVYVCNGSVTVVSKEVLND